MVFKRALMTLGLATALLGGAVTATHVGGATAVHAAVVSDVVPGGSEAQTVDTDANVPCGVDATGQQIGDCQDSQNQDAGSADTGGADTGAADTGSASGQ